MKRLILTLIFLLSIAVPMHAELNYSIDLIQSGIRAQSQWNPSWGAFPIGPSDKRVPGGRVNIARCGCFITSLSTAAEALSGGSDTGQTHPNGSSPKKTLRPSRRRELADWMRARFQIAVIRSCRLAGLSRTA